MEELDQLHYYSNKMCYSIQIDLMIEMFFECIKIKIAYCTLSHETKFEVFYNII